jgi:hypothetical protein
MSACLDSRLCGNDDTVLTYSFFNASNRSLLSGIVPGA